MSSLLHSRKRKCVDLLSPDSAVHSSSLLRLPDSLAERILHYLPLLDKLQHLRHISSAFPQLTADAFKYDDLALNAATLQQLTASARFTALFHRVSSLTVHSQSPEPGHSIAALLQPSTATTSAAFPSLERLRVWVKQQPRAEDDLTDLTAFFRSVATVASLRSLSLKHALDGSVEQSARLSAITLTQLHSLTLAIALSVRCVASLFQLPLTFLDISGSSIHTVNEPAAALVLDKAKYALHSSCRTLRLPSAALGLATALFDPLLLSWPQHSLMRQSEDGSGSGAAGLEHLAVACALNESMSAAILSMPVLRSLQLSGRSIATLLEHATSAPSSRHLRIELRAERGGLEALCGAQPHVLSSHCTRVSLLGLPSVSVVRGLQRCTNLARLRLVEQEVVRTPTATTNCCFAELEPRSMAHVRKLTVTQLPLSDGDVAQLLAACPHLENFTLHLPAVTPAVFSALATHCPTLRTLDITLNLGLVTEPLMAGLAERASQGWFARLTHLQLRWWHPATTAIPPPAGVYVLLASLLRGAPLRSIAVTPHSADGVQFASHFRNATA